MTEIRVGIGDAVTPDELHASWKSEPVALRLTTHRIPVVRAEDFGVVVAPGRSS